MRVGLRPTPSSRTSLPGDEQRGEEEEGGGGEVGGDDDPPDLEALGGPDDDRVPVALDVGAGGRSMRSLWSRLGSGSTTRVSPSASSPAKSRQDLTWALATGSS